MKKYLLKIIGGVNILLGFWIILRQNLIRSIYYDVFRPFDWTEIFETKSRYIIYIASLFVLLLISVIRSIYGFLLFTKKFRKMMVLLFVCLIDFIMRSYGIIKFLVVSSSIEKVYSVTPGTQVEYYSMIPAYIIAVVDLAIIIVLWLIWRKKGLRDVV